MRRWVKIALGVATFLPILVCMAGGVAGHILYELAQNGQNGMTVHTLNRIVTYTVPSFLFMYTLTWGLVIFYIRHASRNEDIPDHRKRFWRTALFFGNLVVMPIYWYKFIWRKEGG